MSEERGDGPGGGIRQVAGQDRHVPGPVAVQVAERREDSAERALSGPPVRHLLDAGHIGGMRVPADDDDRLRAGVPKGGTRRCHEGPPVDLEECLVGAHAAAGAAGQDRTGHREGR